MKKPPSMSRIASKFSDPRNVSKAVEAQKARQRSQASYEPPANPTEEELCAIWSKLLALDKVGRHDNFFALGGHSLMAVRVIARVRQSFAVELPLRAMFDAPTIAAFAVVIQNARGMQTGGVEPRINRVPRDGNLPPSYAQQRLWFIDQLEPGSPLYNLASIYRMRGALNVPALQQAINEIVRRHDSLRTTFRNVDGQPVQVIAAELRVSLEVTPVKGTGEEQREAEVKRLAREAAVRPFDLANGPLFRPSLLRVDEQDHVLIIVMHHIVGDGWSGSLIAGELAALYQAFAQGRPSPLPELPIQYADFAVWQRQWMQGEVRDKQVEYWRAQLAGAPAVIELPTDRPRVAMQGHHGDIRTHVVPRELINQLESTSYAEGTTLFMTLLAAFQLLLSRYSGQDDIVVGSPVAGRNYADIEPLIGFFVNTLALRANLSGNPTFRELLARVKKAALDAYAHQEVPFEKLVEELQPERSLSYNPVFQVSFGLQNMPRQVFQASGLRIERTPVHQGTSIFDMAWFAWETEEGLLLRVEFDTDLFDAATVDRASGHFEKLLTGVVAQPTMHIAELPLLTDAEEKLLLVDWNNTSADYPRDMCAHELCEPWAASNPGNLAIVGQDGHLTYDELNRRANQLAHYLRRLGVGPETLVAICLDRSVEMIVAILGVLKSGGAYLPLDPSYPRDRLSFMLEDAQASAVLTEAQLLDALPPHQTVICLDRDWDRIATESATNPPRQAHAGNLAYVIYTSGSTGKPKGVEIEHRGLVNLIAWHQREYQVQPQDRATQVASPAFDASVWEIWPYLASGATLYIPDDETRGSPLNLLGWMECEAITLTFLPTPLAEAVLDTLKTKNWEKLKLRVILTGGDKLRHRPDPGLPFAVVNHYGPTESTVVTTCAAVAVDGATIPPIGRPIANTRVYVLDRNMAPVPLGVAGELYIAGDGLSRGYRNRPEVTAERFVVRDEERLYRTGDRVRYLPDGNLEFLGRLDDQVKIRGYRIELGEIEALLGQHSAVKECVVDACEESPGNKRLVAYIVPVPPNSAVEDGSTKELQNLNLVAGLQRWLAKELPEFMVPSAFVVLDALPLSPNGKINRRALPAPEQTRDSAAVYVAPRTPLEETLVQIWSDVLRLDKVGVQDNFFALGGHSLLATQVVSRIRQAVGVELPLRHMFEWPTIAELVLRIEELKAVEAVVLPPIQRAQRAGSLPLSFAQQRLWFLNQLEPDNPLYNVPLAVRLNGVLSIESLKRALNEIVSRHEVLRTRYVVENELPVQLIADEVEIAVPVVDLADLPNDAQESAVRRMAVENGRHVFNLETGPVFRASLLKLSEQDHVLLLNTHHIVSDGWSIWRFVGELAALYDAFTAGRPSSLPELRIQYADFAVWQRSWMQSAIYNKQLAYWRKQLDGATPTLELPVDHPRPANPSYRGSTCRVVYPRSLSDKLNELSRREGVTLFMTLMAAYQTLLFRYSGQEDLTVGSPIANRIHAEIEDLIGFFVNTLVIRANLSGNPTFRELLQRVRETALGAYTNQDMPFEKLVEELQPERDLGRLPLFQVWFVLQNAPRSAFQLSGIDITAMDVHNGTSKFDIGMFMVEKPEGLVANVEYSTEMFDESTIQRMLGHFGVLLDAIAEDPSRRVGELPLLTDDERRQIVVEWNDTGHDYPRERSLHQFIEDQVERTPDAPALVFESQELSYRELNARANQLAHRLRAQGVGPEKLVAVCAERSLEMVVGLLGVLKAGGAYVPIDPGYPRSRLAVMLEDAEPLVLLTQEHLLDVSPEHSIPTICLDRDWRSIAAEPTANPPVITTGPAQAYMIYTSGSTGKPKGVPNVHEGIVNRLLWMQGAYGLDGSDRVLQKTPYSFDVSVWEFFWPLMTGACLVVARPEGHRDPSYLVDLIVEQKITTMHFVPSMLRIFLDTDGVERCQSLRRVICSGEAMTHDLQQRFFERLGAELHNLYGPTEAAVDVSYWQCLPDSHLGIVPIGRPIWNTQLYVLDQYLQPVPVGVPGELHIGGVNLARGYWKQPELTAQRFIRDPFGHEPGARLYKTGDLTRFLPDGNIEYLGRIDHQVKLRGFRIELGEIETALDSHPGVGQSVVLAREDAPGDKRLVAYVVSDPGYKGGDDTQPEDALSGEQVSQWTEAFDEAYRRGGDVAEATFNIRGWDSSYTGEAIPAEEMRVWVETTVDRIRGQHPKRVWEIGCGTGLLLFRLAPSTERYYATDVSQTALSFLQQQLGRPEFRLPQVKLERKAAHEFDQQNLQGQFDAVVLNSVIQYFPDLDYLMTVLEGAVESVRPGGAVFIGDVRSFPLLEAFHASVEVFRANDGASREDLRRMLRKGIRQEGELLIDPEFFRAVRQRWPQITYVEIQLKRGRAHNELTRFRYDVVLHVGEQAPPQVDCAWLDWKKQGLTVDSLAEILQTTKPEMLGLIGVPNARLVTEVAALEWLNADEGVASVGDLRRQLRDSAAMSAVEPEDLWALEETLPYRLEVRASRVAAKGCCDCVLRRRNDQGQVADYAIARFPGESEVFRPWATFANNPLRRRVAGKLIPQLRLWLGGKLPEYMVPSAFVLLEAMPLSANGKVNRKALPAPEQSADVGDNYRAPGTPVEEMVAAIFADVLRVERVGVDHDFFELGGNSLSATQVVSRIRQNLQVDLPVRTMFEFPTVAGMALAVEQRRRGDAGMLVPPIVRVSRNQRLPLSFAQRRLWVLDQIEPDNPLYNIPRAIRLTGALNVEALQTAINAIVDRHEILRTTYHSDKGEPFQVIAADLELPLPVVDLSGLPEEEREREAQRIVHQQGSMPFNLARDPITRHMLLKMGDEDHILLMLTHHIASDGWSSGILMRELTALYAAALLGKPADLPELTIQYADYAVWQRGWLQGEVLELQLAYWKQRLAGAPPLLLLPTDRPRLPQPTFRGATHQTLLPLSLAESMRTASRQQGCTAFMTMLAVFQTLVLHYAKQSDIVVGTDLANRTTLQTESLIGFFVNLLALRTDLSGDPTFAELLGRVREVALGAYAHQDVPFDKLVEELQPERSLSHNPLVQVLFVQQNTPRAATPMPGLEMTQYPQEVSSKFDMVVFVSETDKGVAGMWLYNPDLFDATTIARMTSRYQSVLEKATTNPALRLSQLLATLAEEDQQHRASQLKEFQELGLQKLRSAKRKTVTRE